MKKLNFVLSLLVAIAISGVASARDQIKIVGSSTVYPYATIVAEKFGKSGFKTPVIESTGTGGGMKLFCAGVGVQHPDITNLDNVSELSIVKNLPTLVKAYLRLGAKIGDGAVIDYVVKTTDIFIYLPYKNISKTYLKKFI